MNQILEKANHIHRLAIRVILVVVIGFTPLSHSKDKLSSYMATDEYISDRATAKMIINSYTYLKFETKFDNFSNYRLPYEQFATIESAKQWNDWTKVFCNLVEKTKYKQLRADINTNIVAEGEQLVTFDNDFQYNLIKRNCSETRRFIKSIEYKSGGDQFGDLVNKGLKYYKEQLERAGKSSLFLGKVFSDTNGSTYKTVRSVKRRLDTMIKTHEVLFDDVSSEWRKQFNALNNQFSSMRSQSIEKIVKKFKKPRANKNPIKRKAIIERVKILLADVKIEDVNKVMLSDDEMRAYDKILPTKIGVKMTAISFYVLSKNDSLLTYAWYEIDKRTKRDAVYIVFQEVFTQ